MAWQETFEARGMRLCMIWPGALVTANFNTLRYTSSGDLRNSTEHSVSCVSFFVA